MSGSLLLLESLFLSLLLFSQLLNYKPNLISSLLFHSTISKTHVVFTQPQSSKCTTSHPFLIAGLVMTSQHPRTLSLFKYPKTCLYQKCLDNCLDLILAPLRVRKVCIVYTMRMPMNKYAYNSYPSNSFL